MHLTLEGGTIYVYPNPVRRRGREAEGTRLLNEHTPKEYRGFESRRLRQFHVSFIRAASTCRFFPHISVILIERRLFTAADASQNLFDSANRLFPIENG